MKLVVLFLLLTIPTFAQPKKPQTKPTPKPIATPQPTPQSCDMSVKDLPAIRGFKLGMNLYDDVLPKILAVNPRFTMRPKDSLGRHSLTLSIRDLPESERANLAVMNLDFLDGKLTMIGNAYMDIVFNNVDDFAATVKEKLKLPCTFNTQTPIRFCECNGFIVSVYYSPSQVMFVLMDTEAEKEIKRREEEKKKAFKP
jgi:hypothetical protein